MNAATARHQAIPEAIPAEITDRQRVPKPWREVGRRALLGLLIAPLIAIALLEIAARASGR